MFRKNNNNNNNMHSNIIRGAILARVSTDEQADNYSLSTQIDGSLSLANRFGVEVPEERIFRDDESGDVLDRPQLNRLRAMIKRGEIDAIVIHSSDRLARKPLIGEMLLEEMLQYGVRLFIVTHGREFILSNASDRQMLLMEMGFNRTWKAALLEAMNRGKRGKAAKGKVVGWGDVAFGYKKDGNGSIVPVDDEAVIVQNIYYWFGIERIGVTEIIRRLRGIPTPSERNNRDMSKTRHADTKSGVWRDTAIYRILSNPIYKGELTQYGEYTMQVPAIIDESLWEQVQDIRSGKKSKFFHAAKHDYLMRNTLRCKCNYTITTQPINKKLKSGEIKTRLYYECSSHKKERTANCPLPQYIPQGIVDSVIWGYLRELIKQPQIIIDRMREAQAEIDEKNRHIYERLEQLEAMKRKQENKIDLLIDQYSDIRNEDVKAMFRRLKQETEQLFDDINAEVIQLQAQLTANTITDDFIREWERYAKYMRKRVDNATFEEQRQVIQSLNITGQLTIENTWLVAYIRIYKHTERLEIMGIQNRHASSIIADSHNPCSSEYITLRIPIYQCFSKSDKSTT